MNIVRNAEFMASLSDSFDGLLRAQFGDDQGVSVDVRRSVAINICLAIIALLILAASLTTTMWPTTAEFSLRLAGLGLLLAAASFITLAIQFFRRKSEPANLIVICCWVLAGGVTFHWSTWISLMLLVGVGVTVSAIHRFIATPDVAIQSQASVGHQLASGDGPADFSDATNSRAYIDGEGRLTRDIAGPGFVLPQASTLSDLVHLTDRVTLLQDLATLRTSNTADVERVMRIDANVGHGSASYAPVKVLLKSAPDNQVSIELGSEEPTDNGSGQQRQMLTVISHELRTPLNAIIGFSDLLNSGMCGTLADDRQREYVDAINAAGNDLLVLVNGILDVSKMEDGSYRVHPESFDLQRTVSDALKLVEKSAADRSIQLTEHLTATSTNVTADRRAVRQVLTNLLSNAVKFTGEGGCVGVETRSLTNGSGFAITVTDTGIGMTEEQLKVVCQPFKQIDSSHSRNCEGTGIGLALVQGLVDLHGGTLEFKSDPDVGTSVTATFPGDTSALVDLRSRHDTATASKKMSGTSLAETVLRKVG